MAEILDAALITLDDADTSSVACVIDYDWEGNLYDKGETTTTFYLEEEIDLLLQVPPGYSLVSIRTTTGNSINIWSLTTRTVEVRDDFFENTEEKSVTWYPNGAPTIVDTHRAPGMPVLTVTDNKVTCNVAPVILDYDYGITVYSFKTIHPAGVQLEDDETFPQGLLVEVQKG